MEYICIEVIETGERLKIDRPVWITVNRNGILSTPHAVKALGVCDGENIWSLGGLEGYPEAREIPLAEYLETLTAPEADPELTADEAMNILMGGSYETQ